MLSSNPDYRTTVGPGLTPAQAAQARHHSYSLLSRLYRGGVTTALYPILNAIPLLNNHLIQPVDEEQEAAEHYRLFGYHLHPFESIFLEPGGLIGGLVTDAVIREYEPAGFTPPAGALSPDHIGEELAFLAFLSAAEHQALSAGDDENTRIIQRRQLGFMEKHLLCWLPPLVTAVSSQGNDFYAATGELTLGLVADHYAGLKTEHPSGRDTPFALPETPDLLQDENTTLKDIAHYLVTPPYCGTYLGKREIGALGRALNLPRGFGDRQQMMLNLLRTAGQYNQFTDLIQALRGLIDQWEQRYQEGIADRPNLAPFTATWSERLVQTKSLLVQMDIQAGR